MHIADTALRARVATVVQEVQPASEQGGIEFRSSAEAKRILRIPIPVGLAFLSNVESTTTRHKPRSNARAGRSHRGAAGRASLHPDRRHRRRVPSGQPRHPTAPAPPPDFGYALDDEAVFELEGTPPGASRVGVPTSASYAERRTGAVHKWSLARPAQGDSQLDGPFNSTHAALPRGTLCNRIAAR